MQHMMKQVLILLITASALLTSCYYHKEDQLYGARTCDTTNVTYTGTIDAIVNNNGCRSCHTPGVSSGGFNLMTYEEVKAKVTDGRLYGALTHAAGFAPMPQNGPKLTDCEIAKIRAWID